MLYFGRAASDQRKMHLYSRKRNNQKLVARSSFSLQIVGFRDAVCSQQV